MSGQYRILKMCGYAQGATLSRLAFDPYIPVIVTFPLLANERKLYWRMVTTTSLLEVAVSQHTGELLEITVVSYNHFSAVTGTDGVAETTGVPKFDTSLWSAAYPYDNSAYYYDVTAPFVIEIGYDRIRIKISSNLPVKRIKVSPQVDCEFNDKNELTSFRLTHLSREDILSLIKVSNAQQP